MTITPSMSSHRLMVAFCRLDLTRYAGDDLTREQAAVLLPLWCGYAGMTGDERAEVLAAYPVGDPVPVPGVDYLAEDIAADAAVIVAETLAVPKRPPWSAFGACPKCGAGAGVQCVFTLPHPSAGDLRPIAHRNRPLSEVTAQPTGEQVQP